jgi:hypothetical protein
MAGIGAEIVPPPKRRARRHCGFHWGNRQKKSQPIRVGTLSIGGGIRNRTGVRFPKRIAIEPASVRVFGLLSFFPRERYLLKGDADWVGERGSSRQVEPEFDSAFRNRTGVRKSRQPASPTTEAQAVRQQKAQSKTLNS